MVCWLVVSDRFPDLVQGLAAVRIFEEGLQLPKRYALRHADRVVLEERARITGAHVEQRTRPELPTRIENPPVKIEMVAAFDGGDVPRAVSVMAVRTLVETGALSARARSVPSARLPRSIPLRVPARPKSWIF